MGSDGIFLIVVCVFMFVLLFLVGRDIDQGVQPKTYSSKDERWEVSYQITDPDDADFSFTCKAVFYHGMVFDLTDVLTEMDSKAKCLNDIGYNLKIVDIKHLEGSNEKGDLS